MKIAGGSGVGFRSAFGIRRRKRSSWLRERASAISLEEPGRCRTSMIMLCAAATKYRRRTRHIKSGDLVDPWAQTSAAAALSQKKRIRFPHQR